MAFIPQDEDDSNEVGMNVLANQDQNIQQPVEQQNQQPEQQVTGGQSSTIQDQQLGSQTQQNTQQGRAPKGSGMFTDIRKYINANKSAGNRLGSTVAQNVQRSALDPAKKLAEQTKRIQQNYAAQQQSLGQAQQNTQQATQQASQLVNTADLQSQQQRLQSRVGALGNLQQGGYQQQIGGAEQAYQAYAPQVQQAQTAQEQANQALQTQQANLNQAQTNYQNYISQSPFSSYTPEGLEATMAQYRASNPDQYVNDYDRLRSDIQTQQNLLQQSQQEQTARQQALQNLLGQQTQAQTELQNLQDLQGKYERQQDLLGQISGIETQLGGQTELTPQQLDQVRNFLSGKQTFDIGTLNTLPAQQAAQNLSQQAMDLQNKTDIRKRLLQETFGDKYSRGMTGLDDIILARTNQIGKLQQASKDAASGLKQDIGEAKGEQAGLTTSMNEQTQAAKTQSEEALRNQLSNIMTGLEERATTGESGRLGELYQALQSPEGLSQEQLAMLGGEQQLYGLDLQDAFKKAVAGQELQAGDVATGTEKTRIDALRKLLGEQNLMDITGVEPNQYSTAEQNVFENIKNQLAERKNEYVSAANQIKDEVVAPWGEIAQPIAGELASFAQQGVMPTDAQLADLQNRNYWTHAAAGKQGWQLSLQDMKTMISRMSDKYNQLNQTMNNQGKSLQSFTGEAAKDGLIKRNALKRLAKHG